MNIGESLRTWSLALATTSIVFAGAAVAQTPGSHPRQMSNQSAQSGQQSWRGSSAHMWDLKGVDARLDRTLDTSSSTTGQQVEAKLYHPLKSDDGITLPKGTELLGRVDHVQASQNGGPSSISVIFNRARMKDGKIIPVKVTVMGAYPASESSQAIYGEETMGPAPKHINPKERVDQETGLLNHVSMHSAVQSHNSATFRKKDGNLKLIAGTFLQVGIAPRNSQTGMNHGA